MLSLCPTSLVAALTIGLPLMTQPTFSPSVANETVVVGAPQEKPRDLDTPHLPKIPESRVEWDKRSRFLRDRILFANGLLPMPEKSPLKVLITGKREFKDYSVENIAIETMPGFYLCGSLYRPVGKKGPFPAVVNPHGHWANGRLHREPDVAIADPSGKRGAGKADLVAIGVNLAKKGMVCFAYDMVGYSDTTQVNHKFAGNAASWLWGVSLGGLQLWNSIRSVDFVCGLPDVDKSRVGVTGASGGGSQAFLLAAVDDRIKVAVPVNMVSHTMQGGCLCENGPGLRVDTDNVEFAAMMAPKPLLMIAATGDWTKEAPTVEGPTVKKVYDLYGAGDKVATKQFNYDHNYNVESREAMYAWFGKYLNNEKTPEGYKEQSFEADIPSMRVFNANIPLPVGALGEPALIDSMKARYTEQLATLTPKDKKGLTSFERIIRPAMWHSLGLSDSKSATRGGAKGKAYLIVTERADAESARFEAQFKKAAYAGGKLLEVALPPQTEQQLWAAFYTTYNRTKFADAVQTTLTAINGLRAEGYSQVTLVGLGKLGPVALVARGLDEIGCRAIVDMAGFDPTVDASYMTGVYAPGFRRIGDFRTAAMLGASQPLVLFNTAGKFVSPPIDALYKSVGSELKVEAGLLAAPVLDQLIKK